MKRNHRSFVLTGSMALVLFAMPGVRTTAQQSPASDDRIHMRPAAEVFTQLGQRAGVVVLADSSVQARLPEQAAPATADTVEQRLTELVRLLPPGTAWTKFYLPTPLNGRWSAGVVADYVRAQARLLGGVIGRPTPAGSVEIMGRILPTDKAQEQIAALNLKLVYLVTNTQAQAANPTANWARLSQAERQAYAQQQAQRLMSLPPQARVQALADMMSQQEEETPQRAIMRSVMEQLPEGERVQLKMTVGERLRGRSGPGGGGK